MKLIPWIHLNSLHWHMKRENIGEKEQPYLGCRISFFGMKCLKRYNKCFKVVRDYKKIPASLQRSDARAVQGVRLKFG